MLLSGALLPCVLGDLFVMPELWSGVLIALSAVLFGLKRPTGGVIAGLAALFFRELAAPYCVLCVVLAAGERRYREIGLVAGWLGGLCRLFRRCTSWQVCRASQPPTWPMPTAGFDSAGPAF